MISRAATARPAATDPAAHNLTIQDNERLC
jgi:hypothetical protein